MNGFERRRHGRLPIKLDLLCRKLGTSAGPIHTGFTLNASVGGLCFEAAETHFHPGNLAEVLLSVPPAAGQLKFGGTIRAVGKILRIEPGRHPPAHRIALQFTDRPRLYP